MSAPPKGDGYALQILALAAEIKDVKTLLGDLEGIGSQVTALADAVTLVEQKIDALAGEEKEQPVRMWDWTTMNIDQAGVAWETLTSWVDLVLVRQYNVVGAKGGDDKLPACWYRHPGAVAELAWLCQEWHRIYRSSKGTPGAAGEWHDRWLPGVVKRLRASLEPCAGFDGHVDPEIGVAVDSWDSVRALVRDDLSNRPEAPPPKK